MTKTYYISITGLVLRSAWHAPKFYYHAIPSSIQAKSAPGNLYANTHAMNGYMMTMTIWENKKAMLSYMLSGAHVQAMKIFNDVASSGKMYGYETSSPDPIAWQDAYQILQEKGRLHGGASNNKNGAHDAAAATATPGENKLKSSTAASSKSHQHHLLPSLLLVAFALVLCAAALKMKEPGIDKIAAKAIF